MKAIFVLFALAFSPFAHAAEMQIGTLSCNLVNATGTAKLEVHGRHGRITGFSGDSRIDDATAEIGDQLVKIEIEYQSRLTRQSLRLPLFLVSSPLTTSAGYNYQGALYVPVSTPGSSSAWLGNGVNPLASFSSAIPLGMVPWAIAYCSLTGQ